MSDEYDWEQDDREMTERLTKSERREAKRNNQRKMRVSGRSVFELQRLMARPPKRRRRRQA